jgi:hypothetical protein
MPASQSSGVGSKKARKKPRPPQAISPEIWKAVEAAICIGGLGYSEAGRRFGIEPHAILMKAKRHGWPVPSKIAERTQALQARYKACESDRNGNEEVIQAVSESWAQKAERHRSLTFDLAHNSLKAAAKAPPLVESWRDIDLCDKVARRNAGLDSEEGSRISFGMTLVNARLENISLNLPKDALPGMPGTQER